MKKIGEHEVKSVLKEKEFTLNQKHPQIKDRQITKNLIKDKVNK
jgi:hypothetical protein